MRPRRLRANPNIRSLTQETRVCGDDLIYPVFVKEGASQAINSMPGIYRLSIDDLCFEIEESLGLGIRAFALFPVIPAEFKTEDAREAYNPEGFTQNVIRQIKSKFDITLITDVALDPYTIHGHDGLVRDGKILNDETVEILRLMALAQAEAGSDIVAPSDMMDGRVKAIRQALDNKGFVDTMIMSYAAKYASCLYGPFRDALSSLGSGVAKTGSVRVLEKNLIPQDKKTYQMDIANSREALKELELDVQEGADIVMVKPAAWFLDIVAKFKARTNLPVAAYQVSGEYSMIQAAAKAGYIDLNSAITESLTCIKRAGADLILTYFAKDFCKSLLE